MAFKVLENRRVGERDYLLRVKVPPHERREVKGGQFAMVQVRPKEQLDPLLRRPLGVFDWNGEELSFLYRVFGRGTRLLSGVKPGESVEVLYPLGNSVPQNFDRYALLAGGIGIGGLFLAAKQLKEAGKEVVLLYGEKNRENLSALPMIEEAGIEAVIYTEDGSYGKKGLVTQELEKYADFVWVACGPTPMMAAVKREARKLGTKCYLSLDRRMACGVGACLGCTVETTEGYKRCCVEGPVFEAEKVII
jgi:dihydroorotate dehydrogenase electron transfer subunit